MQNNKTWGRNWGTPKKSKFSSNYAKTQNPKPFLNNVFKNSETIDRNINISEYCSFIIIVNKKKYECNIYGVNSSNVIRQFRQKNPNVNQYEYNYENQNNEFQLICDIFNFKNITITTKNMDALLQMSEDLQIDMITEKINKFVNKYESKIQSLEDYTKLFSLLYQIRTITAETVRNSIVNSEWITTEEKIQELAAIILQVSRTNFYIHSNLIDLLILLDQSSEETNRVHLLLPFIINKLKHEFSKNRFYCSFIYRMSTRKLISIKDIIDSIQITTNSIFWFFPELIETKNYPFDKILEQLTNDDDREFISQFLPDKIDQFKKLREIGEPENELEKSILYDDVDNFKQIVAKNQIKIEGNIKSTKLFDPFDRIQKSYINYAAECGSIKCFKYLLLNHANLSQYTYGFAVYGGNTEIVRITDQQNKSQNAVNLNELNSYSIDQLKTQNDVLDIIKTIDNYNNYKNCYFDSKSLLNPIVLTIKTHKYDLFDWIFEQNKKLIESSNDTMDYLSMIAAQSGNCHVLIQLIDNGFDMKYSNQFCNLISISSSLGFYKFANFVFSLSDNSNIINNISQAIPFIFGSLSIFKLFFSGLQHDSMISFNTSLLKFLIQNDHLSIINYIFDELDDQDNSRMIEFFIEQSISNNSIEVFNYLISRFNFDYLKEKCDYTYEKMLNLSMLACNKGNFEVFKKVTEYLISSKKDINYTQQFIAADNSNNENICKYIYENKFLCDKLLILQNNVQSIPSILRIKVQIIASLPQEVKDLWLPFYLNEAIMQGISDFDENLLKQEFLNSNYLVNAIKSNNIEIVKKVLKCNSKPSFINQLNLNGTILNIAVCNNNLTIVQLLLSLPGINPSLTSKNGETPLISAINNHNIEIIDSILDFYGDQIHTQIWQIKKAFGLKPNLKQQPKPKQKLKAVSKLSVVWEKRETSRLFSFSNKNNSQNLSATISRRDVFYHIINRLSKYKSIDLNMYSSNNSFLLYACKNDDAKFVESLLQYENIDVNLTDQSSDSPLIIAVKNENLEISKLLIKNPKTDINYRNSQFQTALTIAVENGYEEIIPFILNDDKFDPIESKLDFAFNISKGHISKLLFTKDLNINCRIYQQNFEFDNFLMHAIDQNDLDKIEMIITHPSFNPIESQSFSALRNNFFNDHLELFNKLYNVTKNCIDSCTSLDIDSLFLICSCIKYEDKLSEIIKRDDVNLKEYCILNSFFHLFTEVLVNNQMAPIHLIKEFIQFDERHNHFIDLTQIFMNGVSFYNIINPKLKNIDEVVQFLLDHNCDPNLPDKSGLYPLEYAILIKSYPFVSTLLNSGKIDFTILLQGEQTYFDLALSCIDKNILKEFYDKELISSRFMAPDFLNFYKNEIFEQYKSSSLFNNETIDLDVIQQIILITKEISVPITMEIILKNADKIEKAFYSFTSNASKNDISYQKIREFITFLYISLNLGKDLSFELNGIFSILDKLIEVEKINWDIIKNVVLLTNRTKFPIKLEDIENNLSDFHKLVSQIKYTPDANIIYLFTQIMNNAPSFYNKVHNISNNASGNSNEYIKMKIKQNQSTLEDKSKKPLDSYQKNHYFNQEQNNDNNNNNSNE